MEMLYVLYDPKCELCERLKDWLLIQKQWLGLSMVPAGSEKAKKLFPIRSRVPAWSSSVVSPGDRRPARASLTGKCRAM